MTLVITLMTPDCVVQAADRRLTTPTGSLYDDDRNKVVAYHDRGALSYTGLAHVDRSQTLATDKWLVQTLGPPMSLPIPSLADAATNQLRNHRLTSNALGFALGAFSGPRRALVPHLGFIANFDPFAARPTVSSPFRYYGRHLRPEEPFLFSEIGCRMTPDESRSLVKDLIPMVANGASGNSLMGRLMHQIRLVASRDPRVGRGVLACYVPRPVPGTSSGTLFEYLPADSGQCTDYGPHWVTPSAAFTDFSFTPINRIPTVENRRRSRGRSRER